MKKAYVKPVFFAEEFLMAAGVAACQYHTGDAVNPAMSINLNQDICDKDNGHKFGSGQLKDNKSTLWDNYALKDDSNGTLFDTANVVCDFVWMKPSGGGDVVKVWGDENQNLVYDHTNRKEANLFTFDGIAQTFMQFFAGCSSNETNHGISYQELNFNS